MSDRAPSTGGGSPRNRAAGAALAASALAFGLLLGSLHTLPMAAGASPAGPLTVQQAPEPEPPPHWPTTTTTTTRPATTTSTTQAPAPPPPPPPPPPTEAPVTTAPPATAPPTTAEEVAAPEVLEVMGPLPTIANLLVAVDGSLVAQDTTTTMVANTDNGASEEDRMLWLIIAGLAAVALLAALLTWRYWLLTRPGLDLEAEDESADDTEGYPASDPRSDLTARVDPGRSPNSVFVPPPGPPYPPPAAPGPDWGRENPRGTPPNEPPRWRAGDRPGGQAPEQRGLQASHLARESGPGPSSYESDTAADGWGFASSRHPYQGAPGAGPTETSPPLDRRRPAAGSAAAAAAVPPQRRDRAAGPGRPPGPDAPPNSGRFRRQRGPVEDGRGARGSGRPSGNRDRGDPFWDWPDETDGGDLPRRRNDATSRRPLNREDVWPSKPNDPGSPRRRRRPRR